jgi:predicted nucleic acid-binding protein
VSVLFDSSVLIAHLRGEPRATDALLDPPMTERLVSALSRVEIEGGMRSAERAEVAALFAAVTVGRPAPQESRTGSTRSG